MVDHAETTLLDFKHLASAAFAVTSWILPSKDMNICLCNQ